MKLTRIVTGRDGTTKITIAISVEADSTLVANERIALADDLAEQAMKSVASARYTSIPLSRVKVR